MGEVTHGHRRVGGWLWALEEGTDDDDEDDDDLPLMLQSYKASATPSDVICEAF